MIVWIPLILISIVLGFLPLWLIIVISVPVAIVALICWLALMFGRPTGLADVIPMIGAICGTAGLVIMWGTYYVHQHAIFTWVWN